MDARRHGSDEYSDLAGSRHDRATADQVHPLVLQFDAGHSRQDVLGALSGSWPAPVFKNQLVTQP